MNKTPVDIAKMYRFIDFYSNRSTNLGRSTDRPSLSINHFYSFQTDTTLKINCTKKNKFTQFSSFSIVKVKINNRRSINKYIQMGPKFTSLVKRKCKSTSQCKSHFIYLLMTAVIFVFVHLN